MAGELNHLVNELLRVSPSTGQEDFAPLYDLQHSFLEMTFSGRSEEELLGLLESVREAAKRSGRHWAHRRACFLLGRLCARRNKYSQVCAEVPPPTPPAMREGLLPRPREHG